MRQPVLAIAILCTCWAANFALAAERQQPQHEAAAHGPRGGAVGGAYRAMLGAEGVLPVSAPEPRLYAGEIALDAAHQGLRDLLVGGARKQPLPGYQAAEMAHLEVQAIQDILSSAHASPSDAAFRAMLQSIQAQLDLLLAQNDESAAAQGSFPITRRAVMLTVVQYLQQNAAAAASAGNPLFPPPADESRDGGATWPELHGVMQALYKLHVRGVVSRGLLQFSHISKAGGSSQCLLAKTNECKTKSFPISSSGYGNCLIDLFQDGPHWMTGTALSEANIPQVYRLTNWIEQNHPRPKPTATSDCTSCYGRASLMATMGFNIYANEFTSLVAPGGNGEEQPTVCAEFVNLIILREPVARTISHLNNLVNWLTVGGVTAFFRQAIPMRPEGGGRDYSQAEINARAEALREESQRLSKEAFGKVTAIEHWEQLAPAPLDNYQIRSLLGEKVFYLPPGNITEQHLETAKQVLASFDIVTPMAGDSARANTLNYHLIRTGLGWRYTLESKHPKWSAAKMDLKGKLGLWEGLPEEIAARNKLDTELYEAATLLGELDTLLFSYIAEGGHRLDPEPGVSCGLVGVKPRPVPPIPEGTWSFPKCTVKPSLTATTGEKKAA